MQSVLILCARRAGRGGEGTSLECITTAQAGLDSYINPTYIFVGQPQCYRGGYVQKCMICMDRNICDTEAMCTAPPSRTRRGRPYAFQRERSPPSGRCTPSPEGRKRPQNVVDVTCRVSMMDPLASGTRFTVNMRAGWGGAGRRRGKYWRRWRA